MTSTALVWFRRDLRVADNPALAKAMASGGEVVAVHIDETSGPRPPGGASRWWLHQSLAALGRTLASLGVRLETHRGRAEAVLRECARSHAADAVYWNRRYEPAAREVDAAVKSAFKADGITAESFIGDVVVEPFDIATGSGAPYSVYSPFWRALRARDVPVPLPAPAARRPIESHDLDATYRQPEWAKKLHGHWTAGEVAARERLADFLDDQVRDYPDGRDRPDRKATSRLSPHLAFGEISPRQVWHAARHHAARHPSKASAIDKFLSELGWREFNIHQLYHRDDIAGTAMQGRYDAMTWRRAPRDLEVWQAGRTGIPVVDAGMRELWETGYMHNRVRMLAGSLLAKNLLIDWREGERWFWDTLCDADVANNPGNWQWVAGSGLDAAPYFRIFNPILQGERFDPAGDYVRRWVPELAGLPDKWVHKPAAAPADVLRGAGIALGRDYPRPIVDLKASREAALAAFHDLPK